MNDKIIFLDDWTGFLETMHELENNPQYTEEQKAIFSGDEFMQESTRLFFDDFLQTNGEHVDSVIEQYHKDSLVDVKDNYDVLEKTWGEGFALYAYYLESYVTFSDSMLKYLQEYTDISEKSGGIKVFTVLRYINGRAIQVANEILVLLRNGYGDGAYSRFRTLFELSIVASFIQEHGDTVAEAYTNYSGSKYEWAASIFPEIKNPKNINLKNIKEKCGIEKALLETWDSEYKLSHKLVHAASEGTFSRVSLLSPMKEILIGSTDAGIPLPATNSLQALFQVNKCYFNCIDDPLVSLWLLTLQMIKQKCFDKFDELEKINFPKNMEEHTNDK